MNIKYKNKMIIICALIVFYLFIVPTAYAKPAMAPSQVEAADSTHIVIAQYQSYSKGSYIDYFTGPIAKYKIVKVLKGNSLDNKTIKVQYDFQDGSGCLPENGWKFTDSLMPAKQSKWILFLEKGDDGKYYTYRGDYGRWKVNEDNINKVSILLDMRLEFKTLFENEDKEEYSSYKQIIIWGVVCIVIVLCLYGLYRIKIIKEDIKANILDRQE